jgi:hypothetical protein
MCVGCRVCRSLCRRPRAAVRPTTTRRPTGPPERRPDEWLALAPARWMVRRGACAQDAARRPKRMSGRRCGGARVPRAAAVSLLRATPYPRSDVFTALSRRRRARRTPRPSTRTLAPLTNHAAGDARSATVTATSVVVPTRPTGMRAIMSSVTVTGRPHRGARGSGPRRCARRPLFHVAVRKLCDHGRAPRASPVDAHVPVVGMSRRVRPPDRKNLRSRDMVGDRAEASSIGRAYAASRSPSSCR